MADKGVVYIRNNKDTSEPKTKELRQDIKKLDDLAIERRTIIYEISSTFPFELFPDRIILDQNTVTIVRKDMLFKRIFPIMYEDIVTIKVNRSILFASLEFEIKQFEKNPRPVNFLWPTEADTARKYIMALTQAKRAGINFANLDSREVLKKLKKIGEEEDDLESIF